MAFSSVPLYLDPPNYCQQQPRNQLQAGGSSAGENLERPPPPPVGGGGMGSIRQGSMVERARLAKLPQPEAELKCPRCESTNTKFCYFNNYNFSQPRHFCKTCRRYWTRGGALRNVPVGGGCKRNKRSKGNKKLSKSKVTTDCQTGAVSTTVTDQMMCHLPTWQQYPFLPNLHHVVGFGTGDHMGLNLDGIAAGGRGAGGGGSHFSGNCNSGTAPISLSAPLSGLEPPPPPYLSGMHQFEREFEPSTDNQIASQPSESAAAVKVERIQGPMNYSPRVAENDQYWSTNVWTDYTSGFTSS